MCKNFVICVVFEGVEVLVCSFVVFFVVCGFVLIFCIFCCCFGIWFYYGVRSLVCVFKCCVKFCFGLWWLVFF